MILIILRFFEQPICKLGLPLRAINTRKMDSTPIVTIVANKRKNRTAKPSKSTAKPHTDFNIPVYDATMMEW